MKVCSRIGFLIALILVVSCAQSAKKTDAVTDEINGVVFYQYNDSTIKDFFAKNHIDDAKREELKINKIGYIRQSGGDSGTEDINEWLHQSLIKAPNDEIIEGPVCKESEAGCIKKVYLLKIDDYDNLEVIGFLISYDKGGNYIDSKVVVNSGYNPINFEITDDHIRVHITEGGEDWFESYEIKPDLKIEKTQ